MPSHVDKDNDNTPHAPNRTLSRLKRKLLARHLWLVRSFLFVALLGAAVLTILGFKLIFELSGISKYIKLARYFALPSEENIKISDTRTNVLILGKAGEGNPAPDLTDTMILLSIPHEKGKKIALISLPRDIWLPSLRAKLNSVYYWGNVKAPGGGLILSKSTVEEIVGVPVHYAAIIDFSGFKDIINALGGVEVEVQNSFVDKLFPISGKEDDLCGGDPKLTCRYETVSFGKGIQLMDGETALKFSRSRHSEDLNEGTDVARARRQQLILEAIKNKITSRETLTSPKKIISLYNLVLTMTETDIPPQPEAILARRILDAKDNIVSYTIPEDLLVYPRISPKYDNLYVFIPKKGEDNWSDIHSWIRVTLQ